MTGGGDVLDALIAGVNILELDPEEDSVGYGGLPNADGVVQLDACCMHGPKRRAGGVAGLEGVRTPSKVARAVMDQTDHHLLVGAGAQAFARGLGFADRARPQHRALAARRGSSGSGGRIPSTTWIRIAGRRRIGGCWTRCSTTAFSTRGSCTARSTATASTPRARSAGSPPRAAWRGRSPAGWATRRFSARACTWTARSARRARPGGARPTCTISPRYLIVENLRRGMHPKDAGLDALRRVRANTVERRLRRSNGEPNFSLSFYILNAKGEHAGVSMYAGERRLPGVGREHRPRLHEVRRVRPERAPVGPVRGARARHPQAGGVDRRTSGAGRTV